MSDPNFSSKMFHCHFTHLDMRPLPCYSVFNLRSYLSDVVTAIS